MEKSDTRSLTMEGVTAFLESSTIHGLAHIATGRKYVRLFWILVVIAGYSADSERGET